MALPQDHVRALDQLRSRLSQLSTSLNSLQDTINHSQDPLPSWPALQADATVLGANLQELASVLNEQRQMFSSMHAYPLPNFPGSSQEVILQGLLRKKIDPGAAAWIEQSLASADAPDGAGGRDIRPFSDEQMEELWSWAKPASREFLALLLENDAMESDYTLKEQEMGIENVVTGIKSLDEDEDENEDEDEDDGMGDDDKLQRKKHDSGPIVSPLPLEAFLRFASGRPSGPPLPNK